MPSKSPAQARTMAAVAHGWNPPAGSGIDIPVKVAKEFNRADKHRGLVSRALRKPGTGGTTSGTAIGGGAAGGGAGGGS